MKKSFLSFLSFLLAFNLYAQKEVTLTIKHLLGTSPFSFTASTTNNVGSKFNITRVDYYISGIKIIYDGGKDTALSNKYILVKGDANVSEVLGTFPITNVEGIKFSIGVENPINHDDPSLQPSTHPLSPQSPSMHWGWSAGYRFVAIEGKAGSSLTTTYEMHGLEDLTPFSDGNYYQQTVMVAGVNVGSKVAINLDADYKEAVRDIDLAAGPINHGDNTNDLTVLKNFRDHVFSPGSGLPTSIAPLSENLSFDYFPNPSTGIVHISNAQAISKVEVYDLAVRKISEYTSNGSNSFDIRIETKGFYFLKLYGQANEIATRKLIIE